MNFSEQSFDDGLNIISSYENDSICIKKKKYYGNLLIPAKGSIKAVSYTHMTMPTILLV